MIYFCFAVDVYFVYYPVPLSAFVRLWLTPLSLLSGRPLWIADIQLRLVSVHLQTVALHPSIDQLHTLRELLESRDGLDGRHVR